jgi:hypothetical protein
MTSNLEPCDQLEVAILSGMHTRMCPKDVRVLERCIEWRYVEDIEELTLSRLAWLLHNKLLLTARDPLDDVRIETTRLGRDLIDWMRKKNGTTRATKRKSVVAA